MCSSTVTGPSMTRYALVSVDTDAPPTGPVGHVARSLDELRTESSVYDDLHVEARRVLDRNPEPRNLRDVAVALESMGYTTTGARALGFDSVFDLAVSVFDLAYLYYLPRAHVAPERRSSWRRFADDYLAGSWYGVPWIMAIVVLFVGRVALWSSLDSTPQVAAMVSLAFFLAAVLAGGCSQMLARKGTFYLLQQNFALVRWTVTRFIVLLSAAPLYMLRRFYTLALATGLALVVTLAAAHLFSGSSPGFRHAQLLGLAVGSGAMVVIAASYFAMRSDIDLGGSSDTLTIIKPPELRVVLWHSAPYAIYGMAYFVMI